MSKQAKNRKPLIVGIVAAVVILAALLVLLLTQCAPGGGGSASGADTTGPAQIQNVQFSDLYWNVDRAQYDGMSEGGMSSRRAESDGYFHVRFFNDGKMVELKVKDRSVVNKIEVNDLMGLEFDDNGIVVGVILIDDMPVEKVGWKFYVQSTGGRIIKVNSSNKFDGLEVLLETDGGTKVYDMTGTTGEIGCETQAVQNDRVMAVADLEGNLLAVYIYDRSNMVVEFQAHCQHCDAEVTWIEWDNAKQLPKEGGHFQLVTDVQLNAQQSIKADSKICLDLNGHTVDGKEGARVYSVHNLNAELAIMDTSEEQTGKLAAHGEIYAQGCVVWARNGDVYMYGGTLDASDAVCTGRGGAAVYVPAGRFFYMYGGELVGGTAKYYFNEETGKYANGLGGNVYCIGKFVLKDGVIRDGRALAATVYSNGKTAYQRGIGGNVYVGSGGEFVMDGGTIKNGRAGSSGNVYLDGTAEFTMNGGTISGGSTMNPGREGGNVNLGAKATFTMNGGTIAYGTSLNNVGNVYCAGTFVLNSGLITGGRTVDAQTGKEKENATAANLFLSNGSKLYMYGGTIHGRVSANDSSTTDGKHTTIVLAGLPKIYSDTEGTPNLTLQAGKEPVRVQVYALHDLAKIGINASGKFTLETEEKNRDNFVSDIEGAEVLYVDKCLAVGRMACLCGSKTETHIGNCDGKELLWGPWTSKNSLPSTSGNYFLANDVNYTSAKNIGTSDDSTIVVSLDLNGKTIQSAQRVSTVYGTLNVADHVGGGRIVGAGLKTGDNHTGVLLLTAGSSLNVYGGTIALADKHYNLTTGGVLGIGKGAVANLYDGVIDGRSLDVNGVDNDTTGKVTNGGAVRLSGTLNVLGGAIYGGNANRAGAIYVESTGVLNLAGGVISGGTAEENGGIIYVAGGTVNQSGGTIIGGSAVEGGNIRIQAKGTYNMTGGVIDGGSSSKAGGNVSVYTGVFNLSGGEVKNGTGSNGGNFAVASTLNITGGTVSGGKTAGKGYGGNIHMSNKGAVVSLSGGEVSGGYAGNRGGNLSGIGTLNMTGGSITAGNAENGGGNIEGTLSDSVTLNISGGKVSGGLHKGGADTDRGNIYMTGGKLNASGNAVIDGGMLLVNNVKITVSGEPQIIGKEYGIRLVGVDMAAPVITVGDLGDKAKIRLNHEGVFGVEAESADTANFIPADKTHTVCYDASNNTLLVGHVHCLCGNGEAQWCDHKLVLWSKWNGKTGITEGNYYLADDVTITKNVALGEEGKTLNICLNGKTITSKNSRVANVNGGIVNIFDHSEGTGALVGTGVAPKETEKDGKITVTVEHSAVAVVNAGATLNLYGGTLKLAEDHNQLSAMGGVMAIAAGGTVNIRGGSVDASASLTSENDIAGAGAIRVSGVLNVEGGQILGGKVTGNGGAILAKSGSQVNISGGAVTAGLTQDGNTAKLGGAIYMEGDTMKEVDGVSVVDKSGAKVNISGGTVSGGTAQNGGTIYVAGGSLTVSGGTVEKGVAVGAGKGGNIYLLEEGNGQLVISGTASITGGEAKQGGNIAAMKGTSITINAGTVQAGSATQNQNNANIYANNAELVFNGGKIAGGVTVINTDEKTALATVTISGDPVINPDPEVVPATSTGLRLHATNNVLPAVKITGALTGSAGSIGITAPDGVFAIAGADYTITEADKACFTSDDASLRVGLANGALELYAPHMHCWCENAENAPAHDCVDNQEWTAVTATKTLGSGYYYLGWTGSKAASITVKAGEHAHLCLSGATIYAGKTITLNEGSTLTICDCGTTGLVATSGGATRSPILLETAATLNLYSGSVTGRYNASKSFTAVTVSNDSAVFNMYGGKLYCKVDGNVSGGNLTLTAGTANILGGTIEGGTNADSYGVSVEGGTLTLGGELSIDSIYLAEGKTITVKDDIKTDSSIAVAMAVPGVFAENVEKDLSAHFSSAVTGLGVGYDATAKTLRLYAAHSHCWCKNAENAQEHECLDNQEWTEVTGSKTLGTGYYYLGWTGSKAASITVEAGKHAHVCLNGATMYAMQALKLGEGSTVSICDCSEGSTGMIAVSKSADSKGPAYLDGKMTINLYSGTITGCLNSNKKAAVQLLHEDAVFNMYGGKVLCQQSKELSGGNILVTAGTANIYGGSVTGGTNADSYGITVTGGSLTLGGELSIDSIYLAEGKTITVKDDLAATTPIAVAMETAGLLAVAEEGKTLTYEGKKNFVSADTALNVACYAEGYVLTTNPVGCLCGMTDGTHETYCTQLDPVAWTGTGLPNTTGNYYLTAPVAVEAATTVAADQHVKLWLQGNDITVKLGSSVKNIFTIDAGGNLELMDTTGNGTVDGLAQSDSETGKVTEHIVENKGALVINGANLDASGLSLNQNGLVVRVHGGGSLTVKKGNVIGGTSTSTNDNGGGAIYGQGNSTIRVEGGTVTGGTAKFGGNISSRGTVIITGGNITNGAYTSRGGNVYVLSGSLNISGNTTNISGGYKSDDSAKDLKDRSNVVGWNSNIVLANVTLEGGVWVTGEKTCTLSGKVDVNGDDVGLTLGASSANGPTARVTIGENFDTTSTVDLAIATWARKTGYIYASGLTAAQADVFTVHTANVVKQQETGKETWEIVYP